jgi:hypothetical protein
MDRIFEAKLLALIDRKLTERLEGADEVWLKPKQLLEQFGMLSQGWLDNYAELLPREPASIIWPDGVEESTRWAYPKHKINRMIKEGKLKNLKPTDKMIERREKKLAREKAKDEAKPCGKTARNK